MKKLLTIPFILIIGFCYGQDTISYYRDVHTERWMVGDKYFSIDTALGFLVTKYDSSYGVIKPIYRVVKSYSVWKPVPCDTSIMRGMFSSSIIGGMPKCALLETATEFTHYYIPAEHNEASLGDKYNIKPGEFFAQERKWYEIFLFGKTKK